jgi:hypothetical protein
VNYFLDFTENIRTLKTMDTERIEIRIPKSAKKQLWKKAATLNMSPSVIIRMLIADFNDSDFSRILAIIGR